MKKLVLNLTLITALFSPCLAAESPTQTTVVYGAGRASCEEWIKKSEEHKRTGYPDPGLIEMQSWILGYMTGVNLTGANAEQILDYTNQVCSQNPRENLYAVAVKLIYTRPQ